MDARLIPDWRDAWRFSTVRAASLLALLSALQAQVLPLLQSAVPAQFWPYVTASFGVAIVWLRLYQLPGFKLIPEWREAWRFTSVQAAAVLTLLSMLQAEVLPLIQFAVPPHLWPYVTASFGVAIVMLRLQLQPDIKQPGGQP